MPKISLCMIVKNEEEVIERCLKSICCFVDEIIIVDTGSTDKTKQLAKNFTNHIFDFVWCDDFSKARNFAISKASGDYVMWLDADDVVPKSTLNYLLKQKPYLTKDCYMLKYNIAFDGKKPTFSFYRERILKNDYRCKFVGAVHECITPFGEVEKLNVAINHNKVKCGDKNRNLKIYNNLKKQRELTPREQYYYSRELFDHKKYKQCVNNLNKLQKMPDVWVENRIESLCILSQCYQILGDKEKALSCLLKTLKYDTPRANVCCQIADYFLKEKMYEKSVYWYTQATLAEDVIGKGGFVEPIYYNYYPFLGLCCSYFYQKNYKKSNYYNEKAWKIKQTKEVEMNRELLKDFIKWHKKRKAKTFLYLLVQSC